MRIRGVLMVCVLALAACGGSGPKTSLTVYAAASLTKAFSAIEQSFEAANPEIDVQLSFAASNQLRTQIAEGAPADVFASASGVDMQTLVEAGSIDATQVVPFARNRLVVVYPQANPGKLGALADLARPGVKLIVADAQVPAGAYTFAMLDRLSADQAFGSDFRRQVEANIVSRELNVKQVVAKIRLGEAEAGIIYVSDVTADLAPLVGQIAIADQFNQIVTYPIAPLKASAHPASAAQFVAYVLSAAGQAELTRYGFLGR